VSLCGKPKSLTVENAEEVHSRRDSYKLNEGRTRDEVLEDSCRRRPRCNLQQRASPKSSAIRPALRDKANSCRSPLSLQRPEHRVAWPRRLRPARPARPALSQPLRGGRRLRDCRRDGCARGSISNHGRHRRMSAVRRAHRGQVQRCCFRGHGLCVARRSRARHEGYRHAARRLRNLHTRRHRPISRMGKETEPHGFFLRSRTHLCL